MAIPGEVREQLAVRFAVLLPHLNERQQRLALATERNLSNRMRRQATWVVCGLLSVWGWGGGLIQTLSGSGGGEGHR
ncbi:hypothetical protein E1281_25060, partial [Actinomadura sp. KC345]|uniref:hypothetical protein n=1 Tax=Actinomadura sp. KC345 TaxID=2530371 RepID=UPI00104699C7